MSGDKATRAVFVVVERPTPEGPRSFWTKIGDGRDNRDGSIALRLDALPLSGTVQVRDAERDNAAQLVPAAAPARAPVTRYVAEAHVETLIRRAKDMQMANMTTSRSAAEKAQEELNEASNNVLALILGGGP